MLSMKKKVMLSAVGLAVLLIPSGLVAQAQVPNQKPQSSFAGKYEATVKGETGEQKITLDVLEDAGKFSGSLTTARGSFKIIKGTGGRRRADFGNREAGRRFRTVDAAAKWRQLNRDVFRGRQRT